MDLKKQLFWIVLGVVVLGEIAFFAVAVVGKNTVIADLQDDVRSKESQLKSYLTKEEIPSTKLLERYQAIRDGYALEEGRVLDYYETLDQRWEPWANGARPAVDVYGATYSDRVDELVKKFYDGIGQAKKTGPDGAFKREQAIGDDNMELVEKRLIIQQVLADIFLKVGVENLGGFQFLDSTNHAAAIRVDEETDEETAALEYTLLPIMVQVTVSHEKIPEIAAEILKSAKVPFRIKSFTMTKESVMGERNPEDESERYLNGHVFQKTFAAADEDAYHTMSDDEILPEPPVSFRLSLEVVDITAVNKP